MAVVNYAIIAICVAVFLWELSLGRDSRTHAIFSLGLIPAVLLGHAHLPATLAAVPPTFTVVTSMFLHGGFLHLIGNMLYLWIFGDNVEESMGPARYAVFYLLCGIAAAFAQVLSAPASAVPMIGASGAISGVLGAYVLLTPRARILVMVPLGLLFPVVRMPAIVVLGIWFALQLLENALGGGDNIAFQAHIGGFLVGMALIPLFKYRTVRLLR